MLKRTLFFENAYHLHTEHRQLKATDKSTAEIRSVPIEDIGFVVFEHPQITFTQSVIQLLSEHNAAVVFCNEKFMPSAMLLNLDANQVQSERFRHQINASQPLKKKLWQQTIITKIKNQAAVLKKTGGDPEALQYIASQVKSGDTTNEEAQAARRYWPRLFGKEFRRDRFGSGPNAALNYGYAIMRAAVARALTGSGLLPTLGIHHHNRYNAYCLADDIMEPFRPMIDLQVHHMLDAGMNCHDLTRVEKTEILKILAADIVINNQKSPLMVGLSQVSAALVRCYEGQQKRIPYPLL